MAEWYVNSDADAGGDGTTPALTGGSCAKQTIAAGLAEVTGNDNINIAAGSGYAEDVTVGGAHAGRTITFKKYGTPAVTWQGGGGAYALLVSSTTSTTNIENLGLKAATAKRILAVNSTTGNVAVTDCTIDGNGSVLQALRATPVGSYARNFTVTNCDFVNCDGSSGSIEADSVTVLTVTGCTWDSACAAPGIEIENNVDYAYIYNNGTSSADGYQGTDYFILLNAARTGNLFLYTNNNYGNGAGMLKYLPSTVACFGTSMKITNNDFTKDTGSNPSIYLGQDNPTTPYIVGPTNITGNSLDTSVEAHVVEIGGGMDNCVFDNNKVINAGTAGNDYGVVWKAQGGSATFNKVYGARCFYHVGTKRGRLTNNSLYAKTAFAYKWDNQAPVDTPTGTAQGGAANSITLAAGSSAVDNYYVGCTIAIAVQGSPSTNYIIAYNGTTKVATVRNTWDDNPDATTTYSLTMDPDGNTVRDNAMVADGASVFCLADGSFGAADTVCDNNQYFATNSGALADLNSDTSATTVANLQTIWQANGYGENTICEINDTNSVLGDPGFIDPANGDFTPASDSLAIDGASITNLDIGGVERLISNKQIDFRGF
jgi:hypothetical protein